MVQSAIHPRRCKKSRRPELVARRSKILKKQKSRETGAFVFCYLRYDTHMKHVTNSLEETHNLASDFLESFRRSELRSPNFAPVFGLYGDLGSGKTAFVQGIARALGVNHQITSPTFVIQKSYELRSPFSDLRRLVHIDAYRFSEGKDMKTLRWAETLSDPGNIVFLEWPEIVESALPKNLVPIRFKFIDENTREIELPEF